MPDPEDRIRDALRATAREPSTEGVTQRVRVKRQRRQTLRKVEAGLVVAALVAAGAVISVTTLDENTPPHEIAVPPRQTEGPIVRVVDGLDIEGEGSVAKVTPVHIAPDEGFVRGPLLIDDRGVLTFAAYNRVGDGWDYPPSRIIRVRPDGTLFDRVDLEGEIRSLAEGEGARWALTHDKTVIGPQDPEFRVKRIGPNNKVASNAVPPGEEPVGDIVADKGGVWVPVSDGVLRFDPATGAFTTKIQLSTVTDRRAVSAAGKFVFATDGLHGVRLDPASPLPAESFGEVTAPGIDELADAADTPDFVQLGRTADSSRWTLISGDQTIELPSGVLRPDLAAGRGVIWVDTRTGDRRYVFQLAAGEEGIRVVRTLSVSRAGDDTDLFVTFLDSNTLFVTSEGRLYRVQLSQ